MLINQVLINYVTVLSIDPAGLGTSGITGYDDDDNLIFYESFTSTSCVEAINYFLKITEKLNLHKFKLLIIEDFFVNKKIKSVLETPKFIGFLIGWTILNKKKYILQSPKCKLKMNINNNNLPLNNHEFDSYVHFWYYKKRNEN